MGADGKDDFFIDHVSVVPMLFIAAWFKKKAKKTAHRNLLLSCASLFPVNMKCVEGFGNRLLLLHISDVSSSIVIREDLCSNYVHSIPLSFFLAWRRFIRSLQYIERARDHSLFTAECNKCSSKRPLPPSLHVHPTRVL